jgi:hypothetical protein
MEGEMIWSAAVAVAFGGLMGWGLGRRLHDLRAPVVALAAGLVTGLAASLAGEGPGAEMAALSLLVGCPAAALAMAPRALTGRGGQLPQR